MGYLFTDTESGGGASEYSLLTCYFEITDFQFKTIDCLSLALKHDPYLVNPSAMEVNQINPLEHDRVALSPSAAGQSLFKMLKTHGSADKLVPVGHGLAGDLKLISEQLLGEKTFSNYISYCGVDTGHIARYLMDKGVIKGHSLSLFPLCMELGVEILDLNIHTAEGDTTAVKRLYHKMLTL